MDKINNFLPTISVIISAVVSYMIAAYKAKYEIKKLKETYNREDILRYRDAYASVMETTQSFYNGACGSTQKKAITAIAELNAVAPSELNQILRKMDEAIVNDTPRLIPELRKELETAFLRHNQNI